MYNFLNFSNFIFTLKNCKLYHKNFIFLLSSENVEKKNRIH